MVQVTVDGSTIYFQEQGSGPPLVLLHGLSGSGRWWRHNTPALAEHFHVYVVDLIGFGSSRGQTFVLRRAATSLVAWLDRLGLESVDLVGHSMGGFIAADLAVNHPRRAGQLVLVDAAALPIGRALWQHGWDMARALRYMPLDFLPLLLEDAARAGPATLLKAMREIRRADLTDRLGELDLPTLVIWGENDTLIAPAIGRELATSVPQAELVMVPGAGHNPMWDRPELFNEIVIAFLRE